MFLSYLNLGSLVLPFADNIKKAEKTLDLNNILNILTISILKGEKQYMGKKWLYRYSPPEKKLGIIYSSLHGRNRFKHFITEDEYVWLGSLTHNYLLKEFPLGPRTAHILLSNVLTADRVYLDLELKVFFRVDPRNAASENLIQVINMPNSAFEGPVRTHTEERIRNEIFPQFTANEALSRQGRKNIRKAISSRYLF